MNCDDIKKGRHIRHKKSESKFNAKATKLVEMVLHNHETSSLRLFRMAWIDIMVKQANRAIKQQIIHSQESFFLFEDIFEIRIII